MKTWLMADTHFGHKSQRGGIISMMCRVKPGTNELFESIEEHDAFLINEINSVVERGDRLIVVGDFAWGNPEQYVKRIKCKNIDLVLGNHDNKAQSKRAFRNVYELVSLKIQCQGWKQDVVLCHYPLCFWERSFKGSVHFYGHCHGMVEDRMDSLFPGRRSMDIGVDQIYKRTGEYKPMLAEELVCLVIEKRSGHDDLADYLAYQHRLREKLNET